MYVCMCVHLHIGQSAKQTLQLRSMKMTRLRNQKANRQMGGQRNGSNQNCCIDGESGCWGCRIWTENAKRVYWGEEPQTHSTELLLQFIAALSLINTYQDGEVIKLIQTNKHCQSASHATAGSLSSVPVDSGGPCVNKNVHTHTQIDCHFYDYSLCNFFCGGGILCFILIKKKYSSINLKAVNRMYNITVFF